MSSVVDSATGAFLAQLRAAGGKPLYESTVEEVRAIVSASSAMLAGPVTEVASAVDRTITAEGLTVPVRVYTPLTTSRGAHPILVFFHGGGFAAGDLETHDSQARYLCQNVEAVVVAVDYRRPPEHKFPAALDDAVAAVAWAAGHAGEVNGDATRLAVAGDSAGGNLATVVCQLARQRGGPRIVLQALLYPLVDFTLASSPSRLQFGGGEYFLSNRDMQWFRELYLEDPDQATDPRVSPLLAADLTGLPPTVMVAAGCDLLRDEGRSYADRLIAAGVPVDYRCFEATIHAFVSFAGAIPAGLEALAWAAARMRSILHG